MSRNLALLLVLLSVGTSLPRAFGEEAGDPLFVAPENQTDEDLTPLVVRQKKAAAAAKLAAETGAYLVMPYGLILPEGIRNESVTLAPDGEFFNPPYAKAHPVLFAGEAYGLNVGVFPTHQTPIGKLATIICYDLNYTDITRIMAQDGAQIIAAPSNDWPGIAEKQNIHLVFRAIETRTAIIDFTLYQPNVRAFAAVRLLTYFTTVGAATNKVRVYACTSASLRCRPNGNRRRPSPRVTTADRPRDAPRCKAWPPPPHSAITSSTSSIGLSIWLGKSRHFCPS
mgnify:CR=1 FL=1